MFKVQKGKKEEEQEGEKQILYPVKISFQTKGKRPFHINEN